MLWISKNDRVIPFSQLIWSSFMILTGRFITVYARVLRIAVHFQLAYLVCRKKGKVFKISIGVKP